MLTLGWSDGSTFLPVNSILLSTENKKNQMFFRHDGEDMSLISIYNKNKKRRGKSKYLLSVMVDVVKDGDIIPAKFLFS